VVERACFLAYARILRPARKRGGGAKVVAAPQLGQVALLFPALPYSAGQGSANRLARKHALCRYRGVFKLKEKYTENVKIEKSHFSELFESSECRQKIGEEGKNGTGGVFATPTEVELSKAVHACRTTPSLKLLP